MQLARVPEKWIWLLTHLLCVLSPMWTCLSVSHAVPRSIYWLFEAEETLPDIRSWRNKPIQCLEDELVCYSKTHRRVEKKKCTKIDETREDASAETTNGGRGLR